MTTLPIERFASEREAEKFEAEAEAAEAQAEADRQKADASRLKEGALLPIERSAGSVPQYKDYVKKKKDKGEKPLDREQWEKKVLNTGAAGGAQAALGKLFSSLDIEKGNTEQMERSLRNRLKAFEEEGDKAENWFGGSKADHEKALKWVLDQKKGKTAAGGLYGYTKGTQRDVEATIRKAQRRAASVAKTLYAKDERSVDFLKAHAKRANSKTARLILAAMKTIGPRVASDKTAAMLPSERHASIYHASEQEQLEYVVDALRLAGEQGLRVDGLPRKGALAAQSKGLADAERGYLYITRKGRNVRMAAEEKIAGGLYGYPTKTARLALVACSDLRAYVGEVAYGLHSRRTARYDRITGFLKEHGKTAKCAYSRMILDCYPDAPVSKQAKEKYPWDECIADQEKQYGSKETAEKVCGKIKAQSQGKSAGDKKKVAPHMYVISEQGGRFMITRGDPNRGGSKTILRGDDYDVRDWLGDNKRKISKDHMIDLTRKFDIPAEYSDFYMKVQGKRAAEEMLKKAFVPDSVDGWLEWEDGTRTATTRRRG